MPRIRSIKPKFWDDIKLSKISRDARLLFIGIWNFSDDLGVIVAEPDYIKSKVFPYDKLEDNQLDFWIKELVDKKFIIPITHKDELFFYIRTFSNHQKIEKPNYVDICIDKEELMRLKMQSPINPRLIPDSSPNDQLSIAVGMEGNRKGIGRDKEGIGREFPTNFLLVNIYTKSFEEIKVCFKDLSEAGFIKWKKFVDVIINNGYSEIFNCKFVNPMDFEKLNFPENQWDDTIKAILATGIKEEQNLFFRIPQFLKYQKNGFNGTKVGINGNGSISLGSGYVDPNKEYSGRL